MRRLIGMFVVVACVFSLSVSSVLAQDVCEGNFDCDQDVDGTDAAVFKLDFGRSQFNNPCDTCIDSPCPCSSCPYGMVDCGNKCVDPLTDEDYCGADMNCLGGTVCGSGQSCEGGTCVLNCPSGQVNCGGQCINTETDESHCGGCFNPCGSGELCVASSCEAVASGYPAAVEKTGQTTSYATGDDGDLEKGVAWPNPRFTDNSDGTVTDNLTGLIWLKDANCFGTRWWSYLNNALSDANGLSSGSCGLTDSSSAGDWRLPNINELASLVHKAYYNPAVPNTAGTGPWSEGDPFTNVQSGYYWSSSTPSAYLTDNAWVVRMLNGHVSYWNKSNLFYVWPVRGGH